MKSYLIDTHILLWWLIDDPRLSKNVREILANSDNTIYVSVVSAWEISIKLQTNANFTMSVSLDDCFSKDLGFKTLSVDLDHVLTLEKLEEIHKDPFDRMLISQAITEDLILISQDEKIQKYSGVVCIV